MKELSLLRQKEQDWRNVSLADGATKKLDVACGDSCELQITVNPETAKQVGVKVMASADGKEETVIYYDTEKKQLVADASRSGIGGRRMLEQAPLELKKGELLQLRVFVDKSVVEVYANDRQAICHRVFPGSRQSTGVVLFVNGGKASFEQVRAWEMMPSNPY